MTALTAELVVDGRTPQTPALAPNRQLLCYVLAPGSQTGDHLDTELWLVDTDGATSRRATTDTATESRPRWSADSGTLFFLSDRADRAGAPAHSRRPRSAGHRGRKPRRGFVAAWAVGQTERFRAALVSAGVTDWGMLAATGENGQFEAALGGSTGWSGIGPVAQLWPYARKPGTWWRSAARPPAPPGCTLTHSVPRQLRGEAFESFVRG